MDLEQLDEALAAWGGDEAVSLAGDLKAALSDAIADARRTDPSTEED